MTSPIISTDFPYAAERDAALEYLRREADSTDGWTRFDFKAGVNYEKKTIPGDDSAIPLVRGRGRIDGVTADQLLALDSYPKVRALWDPRTEKVDVLTQFDAHTMEFYTVQKGVKWIVSPRDIVGIEHTVYHDDGKVERVSTSVTDPNVPPVSGKVRATLAMGGWVIRPVDGGIDVTYIMKVNPNGFIPLSIINNVVVPEIPSAITTCADLLRKRGHPPYVSSNVRSRLIAEDFDYHSKTLSFRISAKAGEEFEIWYDAKHYSDKGPRVSIVGNAAKVERESGKVKIVLSDAAEGQELSVKLH